MSIDQKMDGSVIQILSGLPDFLRKLMLRNKLQEFCSMTELNKHETTTMALKALPSLEGKKLSILTKTWLEVLAEFEGLKITLVFRVYCEELLKDPKVIDNLDIKPIIDAFSTLSDRQKERLIDCFKEVILSLPNKNEMLNIIPKPALKVLKLE
jgi:hypothetical protein